MPGDTSVDLGEGGKIVWAFLGALFTVSDQAKNFKGKIKKIAIYSNYYNQSIKQKIDL